MNEKIINRTLAEARFMIETHSSLRQASKVFGLHFTTIHRDLTSKLPFIDVNLYVKVRKVLDENHRLSNFGKGKNKNAKKGKNKNAKKFKVS